MKTKKIVIHNDVSHKSGYTYKPGKGYQLFDIVRYSKTQKDIQGNYILPIQLVPVLP